MVPVIRFYDGPFTKGGHPRKNYDGPQMLLPISKKKDMQKLYDRNLTEFLYTDPRLRRIDFSKRPLTSRRGFGPLELLTGLDGPGARGWLAEFD